MTDSIIIATFTHKHGSDVRAFANADLAESWRQAIAADYWSEGLDEDMPECPREAADRYFQFGNDIGDEWFSTESATVEGVTPDPVRDAAPAMLAALQLASASIASWIDTANPEDKHDSDLAALQAITAAIAAAAGGRSNG